MSIIIFNNDRSTKQNCQLKKRGNLLELNLGNPVDNGILLCGNIQVINEYNYTIQGEFVGYTTVYRQFADDNLHYILSNDNSVYIPPTPVVEPELPEPTEEELEKMLNENKQLKILESKQLLEQYLIDNPLISSCHNNKEGIYTITSEKQALMGNNYLTYTIEKEVNGTAKLTWNEAGKECEEWTETEYIQLLLEASKYVKPLVSKQQKYEVIINNCTTQEELDTIDIIY